MAFQQSKNREIVGKKHHDNFQYGSQTKSLISAILFIAPGTQKEKGNDNSISISSQDLTKCE